MTQTEKPPARIYLQWYEDDPETMFEGVTWSADRINDTDLCYVRYGRGHNEHMREKAALQARVAKLERQIEGYIAILERQGVEVIR